MITMSYLQLPSQSLASLFHNIQMKGGTNFIGTTNEVFLLLASKFYYLKICSSIVDKQSNSSFNSFSILFKTSSLPRKKGTDKSRCIIAEPSDENTIPEI